jgi:hypothetical protein
LKLFFVFDWMLCVSKIETPNIGWLSCNGFGLQCSNPKPNYNPTPKEYAYIYIYLHISIWVHYVLKLHQQIIGKEQLH